MEHNLAVYHQTKFKNFLCFLKIIIKNQQNCLIVILRNKNQDEKCNTIIKTFSGRPLLFHF